MAEDNYQYFFDSDNEDNQHLEEFNKIDVVNKIEDDEDDINPFDIDFNKTPFEDDETEIEPKVKPLLTEDDLDIIINYDDNKRKNLQFKYEFSQNAKSVKIEGDNLHKKFNDFLILPKISGQKNFPHSSRLPSDYVKQKGEMVEIADAPIKIRKKHHSSVIVNREPNGEVESIEVLCTCGERTLIKFDFAENEKEFDLTEVFNEKIEDPIDILEEEDLSGLDIVSNIFGSPPMSEEEEIEHELETELMFKNEGIDINLKATFDRLMENNSVYLFKTF